MTPTIRKYSSPVLFYSLATGLPWAFWFAAGYISHLTPLDESNLKVASAVAFIGLLCPVVVAYWLIRQDEALRADVAGRVLNLRDAKPLYYVLAFVLMPASILLAQAISLLFGYSASQFVITGQFTFSSGVFPVWFMLLIAPIVEELAWHSYGTDCLRNRMNLFYASLLFGAFWAVWHMPLATIRDYYQSNLVLTGWIYGVNFLVSIVPFVLLLNWLYYKTGRNILVPIVFHITAVYFNEIFATHPDSKIIQTVLLIVLSTVLILRDKEFFFNKELIPPVIESSKQHEDA